MRLPACNIFAEIRRGNKKEERKKKAQDENIYVRILLCRAAINYPVNCTLTLNSGRISY